MARWLSFFVVFYLYHCCFVPLEGAYMSNSLTSEDSLYSVESSEQQIRLQREIDRFFPGDYLNPFGNDRQRRSFRNERDATAEEDEACKPVTQGGEAETELYPAGREIDGDFEWRQFADDVAFNRVILGSLVLVKNPFYRVSLLEPSYKGSCSVSTYYSPKSAVTFTARRQEGVCKFAVNAGYFVPQSGKCLGNIVSDGRVVQTNNNIRNVNFGIRNDGSFVTGYLPDSEVSSRTNPFRQLVSGVIWLVRNGTNYVNESMHAECKNLQTTGAMKYFVEIVSARTAVGHDKQGQLVIAKIEGQSGKRGVNLYELADLLVRNGVWNAINLDGGGSSALAVDGTLAGYPSDHCYSQPEFRCEREVSTVLCVHGTECLGGCSGHGACGGGVCQCQPPWTGPACQWLDCGLTSCSEHGRCLDGKCQCDDGWTGDVCNTSCPQDRYGPGCVHRCYCFGKVHYACNDHSNCGCTDGYIGYYCDRQCQDGFYGPNCVSRCRNNCSDHGNCSHVDGHCICESGWTGENCSALNLQLLVSWISKPTNNSNLTSTLAHSSHTQHQPDSSSTSLPSVRPTPVVNPDSDSDSHSNYTQRQPNSSSTTLPSVKPTPVANPDSDSERTIHCQDEQSQSVSTKNTQNCTAALSPALISALFTFGSLCTIVAHIVICAAAQCIHYRKTAVSSPLDLEKTVIRRKRRKRQKHTYSQVCSDNGSESNSDAKP